MANTKLSNSGLTGTKYNALSADNNYMETIASTLVGAGGSSSIIFDNIPQGYKHLQIRYHAQMNRASGAYGYTYFNINSDIGTSYSGHELLGTGAAVASYNIASTSYAWGGYTGRTGNTSVFGVGIMDFLDYSNTNKFKTVRTLSGTDNNGSGVVSLDSTCWLNTAAITSITLIDGANSFTQYSRISLYGIKG